MANPWFRMYSEFAHDPKVQVLTEALQRRYVMLLCIQCANYLEKRPDDEVALALRISIDEWLITKKEFIKRRLLLSDGQLNGWNKRQYISDIKDPTAAERQQRYRDNKRNVRNEIVTSRSPESDTDTEQIQKRDKRGTRLPPDWTLPDEWGNWALQEKPEWDNDRVLRVADDFKDYWIAKPGAIACKLDWLATWRKWVRNTK